MKKTLHANLQILTSCFQNAMHSRYVNVNYVNPWKKIGIDVLRQGEFSKSKNAILQ